MKDNQFKPAWWLRNPHLQTIWPAVLRKSIKNLELQRERFELPDGDFIDLDWLGKNESGPLVLILHGLEGSIDSHYAKGMMQAVRENGFRGLFMHFRGCSGEVNRLARAYHSGDTHDLAFLVNYLISREPNLHLSVIGYSLGGNILLKWLGETGDKNPLKSAIAVSVPFELNKAANRIQHGFSRFYQWYFLRCLRDNLSRKWGVIDHVHPDISLSYLSEVKTMREFDDKLTAPLHGFSGVEEYYDISSSRQYLYLIQVPTLIVHAKDDPFMTEDCIPNGSELSSKVILELTESGGHVGFVSGTFPWKPEYWLEKRIPRFLSEHV